MNHEIVTTLDAWARMRPRSGSRGGCARQDPERATRLFEQHGDYIRAARLFEDAVALKDSTNS